MRMYVEARWRAKGKKKQKQKQFTKFNSLHNRAMKKATKIRTREKKGGDFSAPWCFFARARRSSFWYQKHDNLPAVVYRNPVLIGFKVRKNETLSQYLEWKHR